MWDVISCLSDIVSLLYHEGRNVRHLVRKGYIPKSSPFLALRDRLATSRREAWKQIQPLRRRAAKAESGTEVSRVFEREFGVTLADLGDLYGNSGWRGSGYGGNAWSPIVHMTIEVGTLIDSGYHDEARELLDRILESSHNTGRVGNKIKELDDWLSWQALV